MKQNSFQSYLSFTHASTLSIQSLSDMNGPVWRAVSFNFGVNWADTVEYSAGFMVANAVYISDAYFLPQGINLCKYIYEMSVLSLPHITFYVPLAVRWEN